MSNPRPYEIIASPFTVYWAPTGEAFPVIDAAPAGNWTKIGTSGDRNYDPEGVTVGHTQEIARFRPLGSTGVRKVQRTEESLIIRFTLWDFLLEHYRLALNNNAVTTTAAGSGTAGFKKLPVYRGFGVTMLAMLVRGDISPEGADWKSQYQVPMAFFGGSPEPVHRKDQPFGLAFEMEAIEDVDAASAEERFGHLIVQHQTAL